MRMLVTGAQGQLGRELEQVLIGEDLILADHADYDLRDRSIGQKIAKQYPHIIIHAAAFTNVDGCERDPLTAFQVNACGTRRVAQGAASIGARLVYISTDYVFDGMQTSPYTETDQVHPLNMYGWSKLLGEQEAQEACPDALIVRTSWLYGVHGKNFVKTILQLSARQPEISVVNDQQGSPTYARHLAEVIRELIRRDVRGVVHVGGEGACSWYDFAVAILQEAGSHCCVLPISTADSGRPAKRPGYSVLSTVLLRQYGVTLPPWRDGLKQFFVDRSATDQKEQES